MSNASQQHDRPLVSVWVISYNQEEYIEETLRSVADQDYPNLQIIVSDDASTDRTPEIIKRLACEYPDRIVPVLNSTNRGITANSNASLRRCTGKYVAFTGGDDLFLPGKIAAQVAWMEADPERVLCGHHVEVFYEDGTPPHLLNRKLPEGRGAAHVVRDGTFGMVAVMIRADHLPSYGFDERLPTVSDYMLYVDTLGRDGVFGYVPGVLARYRRHSANITNNLENLVSDLSLYFDLIDEKHPYLARLTRRGRVRQTMYDLGVFYLKRGRKRDARRQFARAIRAEPTLARAWVRLGQSFV